MVRKVINLIPGLLLSVLIALLANVTSEFIPGNAIGPTVMALLIGMALNPLYEKLTRFSEGVNFTGKYILRLGIILMGVNLNLREVLDVGLYALFVMMFTMSTAFILANLLGKLFGVDWKLTNLLAISTAICGGSAVIATGPVMGADDEDITYAISATFIFDVITVVLFPIFGLWIGMSNFGYGTWIGTAVNDTSSVVAAGYAFSEVAGNTAIIVKLTRTLFIVPMVLIFSFINERIEAKKDRSAKRPPVNMKKIFPFYIILFMIMVGIRSLGLIPESMVSVLASTSRFSMVMALSAIGLNTSFSDIQKIGPKPMIIGFVVDTLVVVVSLGVNLLTGNF